jgi:hypothetical protein
MDRLSVQPENPQGRCVNGAPDAVPPGDTPITGGLPVPAEATPVLSERALRFIRRRPARPEPVPSHSQTSGTGALRATASPRPDGRRVEPRPDSSSLAPASGAPAKPKLLTRLRRAIRLHHYSPRTEQAYVHWVRRLVRYHGLRDPAVMGEPEISAFLTDLATRRGVSASTQKQALGAILLLYREVLGRRLAWRAHTGSWRCSCMVRGCGCRRRCSSA